MARIFISYAREDFKPVKELHQRLEGEGFIPWMDKFALIAGKRWRPAIEQAIRKTDFFVICLSNHSVKKRSFVQREIKMAVDLWQEKLEDDVYLIPVLLEFVEPEEIPDKLREVGWVFLYEEEGWDELLRALKHGMGQRAIESDHERVREEELRRLQEQLLREEQRKTEERREREAKAREQEEQLKAEARALEEEKQHRAEEQRQREMKARQEEERQQREAKAREAEEQRKVEERRLRDAKARQEEDNRKAEERRQREAKAQDDKARQQAEQRRAAETARFNRQRERANSPWQNMLLKRAGVAAVVLLAASLLGWLWLQRSSPVVESIEVLRYSIEIEGKTERAKTLTLLANSGYKFHFSSPKAGFLYLLSKNELGKVTAFRIARPLSPGSDYAFPEGTFIDLTAENVKITVILVPEQNQFGFMPTKEKQELNSQQQSDFETFRKNASKANRVEEATLTGSDFVVQAMKADQPAIFDVMITAK